MKICEKCGKDFEEDFIGECEGCQDISRCKLIKILCNDCRAVIEKRFIAMPIPEALLDLKPEALLGLMDTLIQTLPKNETPEQKALRRLKPRSIRSPKMPN